MDKSSETVDRIKSIDVAKGLLIICIVFSHVTTDGQLVRNWLFAFHVPCFFILSGMLFKPNLDKTLRRGTIWGGVYVLFSLIDIVVLYFFKRSFFLLDVVVKGFFCMDNQLIFNSPKWFLLVLFWVQLISCFLFKTNVKVQHVCIIMLAFLGYFFRKRLIMGIGLSFVAVIFFYMGYIIEKKKIFKIIQSFNNKVVLGLISVILLALVFVVSGYNGMVSIQNMQYGNYFIFFINAMLGSLAIICMGCVFEHSKILAFYGKNTMLIFLTHYYLVRGAWPLLFPVMYKNLYGQLIITIVTMLMYIPMIYIWNRIMLIIKLHRRKIMEERKDERSENV